MTVIGKKMEKKINDTDKKKIDKLIRDALEGSISHYRDYDYDVIKETIIICRSKMKGEQSRQSSSSQRNSKESSKESSQQSSKQIQQSSCSNWSVVYKACCRLMARYVIDMSADKIIEEFNLLN